MKVDMLKPRRVKMKPLISSLRSVILIMLSLGLLSIILYLRYRAPFPVQSSKINSSSSIGSRKDPSSSPLESPAGKATTGTAINGSKCNIFKGKWVPYAEGPYYYPNSTRCRIDDRQNCLKFGRPDTEFMKWRWKPDECELPLFDAAEFLELVRGKSMAFIGDSVGRNQLESLRCLLASVASPVEATNEGDEFEHWVYADYNFTLALIWSTNLVRFSEYKSKSNGGNATSPPMIKYLLNLYLDEVDEKWASNIAKFDYVIMSAGHWFSRPLIYYQKGEVVGCHNCQNENFTDLTRFYGYRMALRTAFRAILRRAPNFKGLLLLRTISPTHFGIEDWAKGGNCSRTRPYAKEEEELEAHVLEFYLTEVDEFRAAERELGRARGLNLKLGLLDVTEAMGMRPDGHPSHYGHPPEKRQAIADCLHWCLPGPVDLWNELLLHVMRPQQPQEHII
ncbi:protein trichome birefringence-like 19 [Diospyros lotus]|uniref:protein trichome birefringence-like 19 n=1 Tax=Diospyros lotus TaxID=55363 RepID=UPI00225BDE4B|nr:protein trichome birefringence-like 19 [Diospyros lotus]